MSNDIKDFIYLMVAGAIVVIAVILTLNFTDKTIKYKEYKCIKRELYFKSKDVWILDGRLCESDKTNALGVRG